MSAPPVFQLLLDAGTRSRDALIDDSRVGADLIHRLDAPSGREVAQSVAARLGTQSARARRQRRRHRR